DGLLEILVRQLRVEDFVAVLGQVGRLDAAWDRLPAVEEEDSHGGILPAVGGERCAGLYPKHLEDGEGQRNRPFDKMGRTSPRSRRLKEMARPLPKTHGQWLKEILLAMTDARGAKPFAGLTGTTLTDADLFHLAPLVCPKFRGRKLAGPEADRVTKGALAHYV